MDLNTHRIKDADDPRGVKQNDNGVTSGAVTVHFKNLVARLVETIDRYPVVVGNVAWLTHSGIISALANKQCSIVVQKEDFLRPDTGAGRDWKQVLRERYESIPATLSRYSIPGPHGMMSYAGDYTIAPIRAVGVLAKKRETIPRAHNKFLVFCSHDGERPIDGSHPEIIPQAVWTGSFNFTKNASKSFENSVFIDDTTIAQAYLYEYAQILALSEPLDWMHDYVEPEWRIGS